MLLRKIERKKKKKKKEKKKCLVCLSCIDFVETYVHMKESAVGAYGGCLCMQYACEFKLPM